MLIDGNFYFEPRARLYEIDEKIFKGPHGHEIINFEASDPEVPLMSHEELMEKVAKEGYQLTDIILKGDKLTKIFRLRENGRIRILKAKYWGGLELAEANEVKETIYGRYKMRRIPPIEGERALKNMDGVFTRIERDHNVFEMAEVIVGGDEDEEGNLIGVGLVWSPSKFWPTRYYGK